MKRTKKALAVVLSLSMLASITPQIVLANSNIPDRYEEVSEMQAIVKDAEVHAYVTRNGGTAELTDSNGVETTLHRVSVTENIPQLLRTAGYGKAGHMNSSIKEKI